MAEGFEPIPTTVHPHIDYFVPPNALLRPSSERKATPRRAAAAALNLPRSSDEDTNRLVFISRLYYARAQCDVWYDYVPSASNIADLPTRLDAAAFTRLERVARRVPFKLIPEWCMSCSYARLASLF